MVAFAFWKWGDKRSINIGAISTLISEYIFLYTKQGTIHVYWEKLLSSMKKKLSKKKFLLIMKQYVGKKQKFTEKQKRISKKSFLAIILFNFIYKYYL